MTDRAAVERIDHDRWCCDERERPHVHVQEKRELFSFRLGWTEHRGPDVEQVLQAVTHWLAGLAEG